MRHGAILLWLLLASGCSSFFGSRGLPADPLFAHRKPIESAPNADVPRPTPPAEPLAPVNPYVAAH